MKLATWNGLEPSTSSVTGWHSNQLNYQAIFGGRNRARTYDPLLVRQMLSQLSYTPKLLANFKFQLLGTVLYYILSFWICQVFSRISIHLHGFLRKLAPRVGLEPTAYRLTAECSTIELPWNIHHHLLSATYLYYHIVLCLSNIFCGISCAFLLFFSCTILHIV